MSLEIEDQHCVNEVEEGRQKPEKKLMVISYTRDFLLSLSELDVCKKLPSGFDQSILSEFEDASQDRFRNPGGFSSQSYRRNEYGSSPPTRGDGSNHSRGGVHGRWESRSSGRSDRDSDSQSDLDSDSGRRYNNPPRRPWQAPEHDGLLGSGSFARSSGYATTGASASKLRANDNFPLNRSSEPYHPPRPYKAVPHSRRETNDSYNDETFGSSECTSEDRAEEERKRRDSFELMRKEQHKAFQEKQKLNPGKGKDEFDLSELLEDSKDDKKFLSKRAESDERVIQPASRNDSDKSLLTPAPVSRPLVPPGFSSTTAEKNIGMKSSSHPQPSEISNELEGGLPAKGRGLSSGISTNQEKKQFMEQMESIAQQSGTLSAHGSVNKEDENILNISSALDVSSERTGMHNRYYRTSKLSEAFESSENTKAIELDAKDLAGSTVVDDSTPTHSTSILDKLFGSALTLNGVGSSSLIEQHDVKADDSWNSPTVQSSRFAQWFLEEEKKPTDLSGSTNQPVADLSSGRTSEPVDDLTSGKPNDLLSLIVGSEKSGSHTFDVNKPAEKIPPNFRTQGSGLADGQATSELMPETVENVNKEEAVSAVLTCEDLEQSMLSEISDNGSVLIPSVQGWSGSRARTEQQKANIDDHASQHLLSLLQMGTELPTSSGIVHLDKPQTIVENVDTGSRNSGERDPEHIHNAGKPLTLETLFGTAFMKELQSVGTQASSQRGLVGLMGGEPEAPFPVMNDGHLASMGDASSISSIDNSILVSNQRQQMRSEGIEEQILGFGSQKEVDSSHLRAELGSKLRGFDGSTNFRLPEEDSLITGSDPLNLQNFVQARSSAKNETVAAAEFAEKLAALHPVYNHDGGPMIGNQEGSFFRGNFEMREPDVQYHKIHAQQPSSPQLHPQLNHAGSMFHQLDSRPININAQMKLMTPENAIHHDAPNHQFPSNLIRPSFHHPNAALAGLVDHSPHNPMLQQMHVPGNFPPPHLLRGFPRGPPLSLHPNNQATGFIQEQNPLQGFPFGQRPPNFNSLGVPPQAPDVGVGTHHPEALQRLIEMELRSNPKPIHPFATSSHNQGIYGHELDMGFRYR